MLNFKKIELKDFEVYNLYIKESCSISCENNFINQLIWQQAYNMMAVDDGQLFLKSGKGENESFRFPIGGDFKDGLEKIFEFCGDRLPAFWVQEGENLDEFKGLYGELYDIVENRDSFDYIYSRENLAFLSGKKYHSKRNHISAFSKQYSWRYEAITPKNADAVRSCAEKWYEERQASLDSHLVHEKNGLEIMLSNMESLSVKGGAIFVDEKIVAFTLGSPINDEVFNINIEKALPEFSTAYTVINREFAKNELGEYKFLNREDDLGLEGLRRAKLSYKPEWLLKKYILLPRCLNDNGKSVPKNI